MWLLFFVRLLDLIAIWFGEDQRANIIKTNIQKRLNFVFKQFITAMHCSTLNSEHNWEELLIQLRNQQMGMHF